MPASLPLSQIASKWERNPPITNNQPLLSDLNPDNWSDPRGGGGGTETSVDGGAFSTGGGSNGQGPYFQYAFMKEVVSSYVDEWLMLICA